MSSGLYRQKGTKINFSEKVTVTTYLLFVTDTTDGVCVKKIANIYRFNAKNWQFTVYFAIKKMTNKRYE